MRGGGGERINKIELLDIWVNWAGRPTCWVKNLVEVNAYKPRGKKYASTTWESHKKTVHSYKR